MNKLINELKLQISNFFKINKLKIHQINVEIPPEFHGDLSTNFVMTNWKLIKQSDKFSTISPRDFAIQIIDYLTSSELSNLFEKITVENPAFINFYIKPKYLRELAQNLNKNIRFESLNRLKIMVEYGHPNTHKQLHIGHLRTLVTGESLARLNQFVGNEVFRANYQGDIGPHVAKAIWGIQRLLEDTNQTLDQIDNQGVIERGNFLGKAYVRGSQDYENNKLKIDEINRNLYAKEPILMKIYDITRQWSLDYYDHFYNLLGIAYDEFFFETQVADEGLKIVKENLGKIFIEDQGAIIFDGELFGLHKRVFVTSQGTPTYEAKDLALANRQYKIFNFDKNLHIVANEQTEYFKVVFQALKLINPEVGSREVHVATGMVNLVGLKMSSRTGVIVTVDDLYNSLVNAIRDQFTNKLLGESVNMLALSAMKYEILRHSVESNITFDISKSIQLTGNTGPYLQYTHARCCSILDKHQQLDNNLDVDNDWQLQEDNLVKSLLGWDEVIIKSVQNNSLHHLCEYLYKLASNFNQLYNDLLILNANEQEKNRRLFLTQQTKLLLNQGLHILGIDAPNRI